MIAVDNRFAIFAIDTRQSSRSTSSINELNSQLKSGKVMCYIFLIVKKKTPRRNEYIKWSDEKQEGGMYTFFFSMFLRLAQHLTTPEGENTFLKE